MSWLRCVTFYVPFTQPKRGLAGDARRPTKFVRPVVPGRAASQTRD